MPPKSTLAVEYCKIRRECFTGLEFFESRLQRLPKNVALLHGTTPVCFRPFRQVPGGGLRMHELFSTGNRSPRQDTCEGKQTMYDYYRRMATETESSAKLLWLSWDHVLLKLKASDNSLIESSRLPSAGGVPDGMTLHDADGDVVAAVMPFHEIGQNFSIEYKSTRFYFNDPVPPRPPRPQQQVQQQYLNMTDADTDAEKRAWQETAAANGVVLESVDLMDSEGMKELYGLLSVTGVGPKSRLRAFINERQQQQQQVQQQVQREMQQQVQQQRQALLDSFVYRYGANNGVNPSLFENRVAVANIMKGIPRQVEHWSDDRAKLRIQLHGPPGSGKSSIMGKIDRNLRDMYPNTPVYFVQGARHCAQREQVLNAIWGVQEDCVVLLDDAQHWYDYDKFWALFKDARHLLVFAATHSVRQFNPETPVNVQLSESSNLLPEETAALLARLEVDECHFENMTSWFGSNYGRYHLLVPELLRRWEERKQQHPAVTLEETFFRADTMQDLPSGRLLPSLSDKMRETLLAEWRGQLCANERNSLVRYGVFNEQGKDWSCEYVRRKYFDDLFHSPTPDLSLFADYDGGLPPELDLLKAGLGRIKWAQLKQSAGSSRTGFPIDDVWQAEFYGGIGELIPRSLVFCKEYVAKTDNRVDFVLRNGSTRAIEFLIKSSDVGGHHHRFESGAYSSLRLSGSYLVVDIKPWGQEPDIHDVPDSTRRQVAGACFETVAEARRPNHAVFLVSNDLSSGILYTWDGQNSVVESLRSPHTSS